MTSATDCLIIGGGPAGLTTAYELGKYGKSSLVLEGGDDVGGLSKTCEYKGYRFDIGGRRFYTCQTGQKGICRLRLRAKGRPGHGSVPHDDNAVLHLCRALGRLHGVEWPLHPSATLKAFLQGVAEGQEDGLAAALRAGRLTRN